MVYQADQGPRYRMAAESAQGYPQRAQLAQRIIGVPQDPNVWASYDLLFNFLGVMSENEEQGTDFTAQDLGEVLQKGLAAQGKKRFIPSHAPRFPGGQEDACHG